MKLFGIDLSPQKTDKGVVISAEAFAQLEAKTKEIAEAEAKEAVSTEQKPILEALTKLTGIVEAQGKELTALKKWADETPATTAAVVEKPAEGEENSEVDAKAALNSTFAKFAANGVKA